jgi:hypothetical protein
VAKPRKRGTGSNLVDMGRGAVRDRRVWWSTPKPRSSVGGEAMVKDYGVAMAMLPGQELGISLVDRSCSERGNHPRSPSGSRGQRGSGQARCRLMAVGWGGGLVVVRAHERCVHGEGGQQVSGDDAGMPGGCRW